MREAQFNIKKKAQQMSHRDDVDIVTLQLAALWNKLMGKGGSNSQCNKNTAADSAIHPIYLKRFEFEFLKIRKLFPSNVYSYYNLTSRFGQYLSREGK